MEQKKVLITGATGMIGGLALRMCLENESVGKVTSLGRRSCGVQHDKLFEVMADNFFDFMTNRDLFKEQDVALFCLGAYTGVVPDDEFRKITVDYVVSFAEALREQSPQATICLLSGQGADRLEKSRIAFARYKGMAENALLAMGFPRVHIFRPGYIYPVTPRSEPNMLYRVFRSIYPVLRCLYPNVGVSSDDLAKVIVSTALSEQSGATTFENYDIRMMAKELA